MNNDFTRGMSKATELTRSGKLTEATALIQSLLRSASAPNEPTDSGDFLEGEFVRLEETAPETAPPAPSSPAPAPHTRLGERLRRMATSGMPGLGAEAPAPAELPDGAQFLSLTHRSGHSSRDYRLYVPAARPEGQMPLIVMLHGCTQSPEDFAAGTGINALAEEFGCLVAWPAQPQRANAQKCWNWFRPEDQGRDRGEPALIAGIVRDILGDHAADPVRVYIAGLSAGGAAAAIMGAAYPELFAAVGVHSGLPVGGAQDMPSAFAAMRGGVKGQAGSISVPTIVFHGIADGTVHPGNGEAVLAQALKTRSGLKRVCTSGVASGGRKFRQTCHVDAEGRSILEHWEIDGAGHAWAGGKTSGSYTDPKGPDASREMLRFFLEHRRA